MGIRSKKSTGSVQSMFTTHMELRCLLALRARVKGTARQHPCASQQGQQGGLAPQRQGLDTNLANRALAKASLILQPPENSLRREEIAERG